MKVAFRADASIQIGTGHIMRCLTLARALRDAGAACHFIMRCFPGDMAERVSREGFATTCLPAPTGPVPEGPPDHAYWAGVAWQVDARETRSVLDDLRPDWLILDHYAFDARWQRAARPEGTRVLVLDDLADRPHDCDLLLDQNLGRKATDYDGLVPDSCTRLIGPHYAVLRPEFADLRAGSLLARAGRGVWHLLISMGGVDADDSTSAILLALRAASLPEGLRITVVMGSHAPALEHVRAVAQSMPCPTELVVDVNDMGAHMAQADLAIGAGGATTWERCCLGLPSVIIPIAANQTEAIEALFRARAALAATPPADLGFPSSLQAAIAQAEDALSELTENSAGLCDGDGALRVLAMLAPGRLAFRDAMETDARRVWDWRAASDLERFALAPRRTGYADHVAWFRAALHDPKRIFRVLLCGNLPCGYLRLDMCAQGDARVSLCLAPDARRRGLAATLLAEAERQGRARALGALWAEVHPENAGSLACFERAGYTRGAEDGGFRIYHKSLREGS